MRKLVIILLLAVLGLAGCSGDDGGGDVDVAAQKDDADATAEEGDDAEGGEEDPDFTGKGGKDFCEYLEELEGNEDQFNLGTGEDTPENRKKAKEGLEALDELEDKAPAEIKADVVLVMKQVRPFFEAFAEGKDLSTTPTSKPPTEAEQAEFEAANERLEAYSANVCGIKEDSDDGSGTSDGSGDEPTSDEQAPQGDDPSADG